MSRQMDHALDACLSSLAQDSASLDECLTRLPEYADELRPLLELASHIELLRPPPPGPQASAAGRARMLAALEEKRARRTRALPVPGATIRQWRVPRRLAAAGIVALVLVCVGALIGEFLLPPIVARAATLKSLNGVVEIWLPRDQVWEQARTGARLPSGGRVRTGPGSSVTLALLGSGTVDLASQSEVELVELRSRPSGRDAVVVLRQLSGSTFSRLRRGARAIRRFQIETPHARVQAQSPNQPLGVGVDVGVFGTDVAVAEGRVSLESASGEASVGRGETARVESGRPLATPVPSIEVTPQRGGEPHSLDEDRHGDEIEQPSDGERGSEAPAEGEPAEDRPGGVGEAPAEGTPEPGGGDGHDGEEGSPQTGEPGKAEPTPSGEGSRGDDSCVGDCTPPPGSGSGGDNDRGGGDDKPGTGSSGGRG